MEDSYASLELSQKEIELGRGERENKNKVMDSFL